MRGFTISASSDECGGGDGTKLVFRAIANLLFRVDSINCCIKMALFESFRDRAACVRTNPVILVLVLVVGARPLLHGLVLRLRAPGHGHRLLDLLRRRAAVLQVLLLERLRLVLELRFASTTKKYESESVYYVAKESCSDVTKEIWKQYGEKLSTEVARNGRE